MDQVTKERIRDMFRQADGVVILAGAGMGVDSGLPDFRGESGFWTQAKEDFVSLATARGFDDDPVKSWNFYIRRMMMYDSVLPHRGYLLLRKMLDDLGKDRFVITTNVDGHFIRSGYDPGIIHEMHGDLRHAQCNQPCSRNIYPMPRFIAEVVSPDDIPRCPGCGYILRPNVMMFSDSSLVWKNIDSGEDRYRRWAAPKMYMVGIEIGAGTAIPSLRYIGEERTAALIRINPAESEVRRSTDVGLALGAIEGVDALISMLVDG